jgi:hypothetical protein
MANTNAPFGFRQYSGNGSAPTYEQVVMLAVYNAGAIYYGDPVEQGSGGYITQGDGTTPASGIAGIFVGCQYLSVSQKRTVWSNYWPGSDVASGNVVTCFVINDPNARFLVQTDATGFAQTIINSNVTYDIGAGNTANGISGAFVTSSSATTDTLAFRVWSLVQDPPGAPGTAAGAYNYVIVGFNNVATKQLTGI